MVYYENIWISKFLWLNYIFKDLYLKMTSQFYRNSLEFISRHAIQLDHSNDTMHSLKDLNLSSYWDSMLLYNLSLPYNKVVYEIIKNYYYLWYKVWLLNKYCKDCLFPHLSMIQHQIYYLILQYYNKEIILFFSFMFSLDSFYPNILFKSVHIVKRFSWKEVELILIYWK